MQDNEQMPALAQKAISDLISVDYVTNIRETLTEIFYQWVRSDLDYDCDVRRTMLSHYTAMIHMLEQAEQIQQLKIERRVSV